MNGHQTYSSRITPLSLAPSFPPDGLHNSSTLLQPSLGRSRVEELCSPSGGMKGAGGKGVVSELYVCWQSLLLFFASVTPMKRG